MSLDLYYIMLYTNSSPLKCILTREKYTTVYMVPESVNKKQVFLISV